MTKKFQSITNKIAPFVSIGIFLCLWLFLSEGGFIPKYMLPSPIEVGRAFVNDFPLLMEHLRVTLKEAIYGLLIGTGLAFVFAVLMDRFEFLYKAFYPILVITQTIPTIAIAPLLVLWMGFSIAPKITLVVITTFFPITISLLDGFKSADEDAVGLIRSMGGNRVTVFRHIKLPSAMEQFFSGLKVSASYAVVGAVVSEWLGGFEGLGVYMTRVKKAYAFDKMFAVIILISAVSLLLMAFVALLRFLALPHKRKPIRKDNIMKKTIAIVIALVLVFGLVACGKRIKNSENSSEITLCLDWTPNTNHTGFFVADKLGYYDAEGLKVTIVQPPENGAELMVASNQAQFGITAQDSIAPSYASENPLEVTAVAALLQHNTSGIISRKGDGCTSPKGLEGKTYSTWDSPVEKAMISYLMEKEGADFSKVNLIPNVITNEPLALKNKDTDAIWIFYGWGGIQARVDGVDCDYFHFRDIDEVFDYYTPTLIANNGFLQENPDTAKAFLKATAKGYEYAAQNPEEAAEILIEGDTTGSLNGSVELVTESQKWISKEYISDAPYWGYIDPARWDTFYGWLYENELVSKDLRGIGYCNDYLKVD